MKRNNNNYRLNKNGKPIITEIGEIKHKEYKGTTYKENGEYYFFKRQSKGYFYYSS